MLPQDRAANNAQPSRVVFRYMDAIEVKPRFLNGTPLEELAQELAAKRHAPYAQALHYLETVRAREGWIEQQRFHLEATANIIAQKIAQNRANAIAKAQGSIADRLIQKGLEELNESKAKSRADVLNTLEHGYRFAYRAEGLPDRVADPAIIPQNANLDTAQRQNELQNMDKGELLALIERLVNESK